MKEAKNNKKIGHKLEKSFLQKILGFRFTPSISAWKLAIALFLLITIAYAVNGAGVIAKGESLEVSGNATVQGKVGIGTTSPNFLLNVVSSGTALPVEISASSSGTGNSFGLLRLFRLSSAVKNEAGIIFSLQDTQPARQEYGYIAAKIISSTSEFEAGDLLFSTTNAGVTRQERMRITSTGNVGIGTTAPARNLHIKNSAADNVLVVDSGDNATKRFSAVDLHDNGAAKWGIGKNPSGDFYIDQSGVGNAITILGSNRNVGIGTTSPGATLQVSKNSVLSQIRAQADSGGAGIEFYSGDVSSRNWALSSQVAINGDLVFQVSPTQGGVPSTDVLNLLSNGNVGIGTTSPDGMLHVHVATAGTITPNAIADDLIVENSVSGGISILTPDASQSNLFFGSPTDPFGAGVRWQQSTGTFLLGSDTPGGVTQITSGNGVVAMTIGEDRIRIGQADNGRFRTGYQRTTVGTTPTTIFSSINGEESVASGQSAPMLLMVAGDTASAQTHAFFDLLMWYPLFDSVVVVKSTGSNSPNSRSYTNSGNNLQLAMGTGAGVNPYIVNVQAFVLVVK